MIYIKIGKFGGKMDKVLDFNTAKKRNAIPEEFEKKNEIMLPKVAFICVHNSCRSQIAEALGNHLASEVFDSYSAGTETKPQINQDAVRLMKEIYGIDMEKSQKSKLLEDIPEVDIVVTMGCNVQCPFLPCKYREDWGVEDPSGKSDEEFIKVIQTIEDKIIKLKNELPALLNHL